MHAASSYRRYLTTLGACFLAICCLMPHAHAAASLRFWVWTAKDRKKIAKYEKKVKKDGNMYVIETKTFTVKSEVDAGFTAEFAYFMDLFVGVFPKIFAVKGEFDFPKKPEAVIFANQSSYSQIGIPGSGGVFWFAYNGEGTCTRFGLYSYPYSEEAKNFCKFYTPILMHEGSHMLLQGMIGKRRAPVWFNEGLATYFQYWEVSKSISLNRKNRYLHSDTWNTLKAIARRNKNDLPALSYLTKLTSETWNCDNMGPKTSEHYALAESFMDYLLTTKGGRKLVKKMFARLLEGKEDFTESTIITDEEIKDHESDWHKHILNVTREKLSRD